MSFKEIFELLKQTYQEWSEDKASTLGAALAFYSMSSLAPMLVIAISIAGIVLGSRADARQQVLTKVEQSVGPGAAEYIQSMIQNASQTGSGTWGTIIGVITLLMAASAVFGQLQDALNTIWEIKPRSDLGIWGTIKARLLSLAMVLGIGFLLLISQVLTTVINALATYMTDVLPLPSVLLQLINFGIQFGIITLLFAAIFKVLPDVEIEWHDVWIGAALTALLFVIGQFVLSWYLGSGNMSSAYGAAGSLVVLLFYIYYSSLIMFFGAEFTQVYANKHGSQIGSAIQPSELAEAGSTAAGATGAAVALRPDGSPITPPRSGGISKHDRETISDLATVAVGFGLVALYKILGSRRNRQKA